MKGGGDQARDDLGDSTTELNDSSDVTLDLARESRLGFPEVVYGQHKSSAQLERILATHLKLQKNLFITRLQPGKVPPLLAAAPAAKYREEAQTLSLLFKPPATLPGTVGIVCAGTSDTPVVAEIEETLTFLGVETESYKDVGVAGIERLFNVLPQLKVCDVIICAAGFEGALASVLGGLLAQPLIAVPTGVGYGVAAGGHAALNAMLASCANGITVVNIDNGYGAALAAFRILQRMSR